MKLIYRGKFFKEFRVMNFEKMPGRVIWISDKTGCLRKLQVLFEKILYVRYKKKLEIFLLKIVENYSENFNKKILVIFNKKIRDI